jgi:hypothetical protein
VLEFSLPSFHHACYSVHHLHSCRGISSLSKEPLVYILASVILWLLDCEWLKRLQFVSQRTTFDTWWFFPRYAMCSVSLWMLTCLTFLPVHICSKT